ncbi:MAG: efflux RND transporter periplasmic adaptor subunit [Proteobacteria bacterium]|nr:efflux RND transporter periplasmic adaptor subunit [Pseudomonadota bacterium]
MDYIPVYEGTAPEPQSELKEPAAAPASGKGKIAYYRNPMGLPDISMEPKKDSMGMDYIPVYEDEATDAGADNVVQISLDKIQKLGVTSAPAQLRRLTRAVRAVGTVEIDESRQVIVTSKFDGWIEKLKVMKTGDTVSRGDGMLEIFSPTLRIAESQYLSTLKSSPELVKNAKDQLRNKGMTEDQIATLEGQTTPPRTMMVTAPAGGQVIEKQAILGMRVEAGDPLYRLVDLSHVWVIAEIHEQDIASIRPGLPADITFDAWPGKAFTGTVSLVYPMVATATRTAQVRVELDNQDELLRPGMFASVSIDAEMQTTSVLAIPENAVLDDGLQLTVLIDRGGGRFEPRSIQVGSRADGFVAVTNGLAAGDKVVVSANFLIDAESNLQAALRAFTSKQAIAPETAQ